MVQSSLEWARHAAHGDRRYVCDYSPRVHGIRRIVLTNRLLAGIVVALALAMKIIVPGGFMPVIAGSQLMVSICSGTGPVQVEMAVPRTAKSDAADPGHHGKVDQPCAYAGLISSSLAAVDALVLAAAILFILALAIHQIVLPAPAARHYSRPPLRGPPATA